MPTSKLPIAMVVGALFAASACAPEVRQHSGRDPDLFDKESDHLEMRGRPIDGNAPTELFVRKPEVSIKPAAAPNETGSLFNPEDERNYLFTNNGPYNIGRYLTIFLKVNRIPLKPDDPAAKTGKEVAAAGKAAAASPAKDGKPGEPGAPSQVEEDLLKALPDLAPKPGEDLSVPKSVKMKIVHRFDNGDVLAMMTRRSTVDGLGNELTVQARIPYNRLSAGDDLSTDDLLDVRYNDSMDGELADRRSSGWEDEYSLRMAGFNESKSRQAKELEDKRLALEETKTKLEDRIKSLNNERTQLAKLREDNAEALKKQAQVSADATTKTAELTKQIDDQKKQIADKDAELADLKEEEKPGDKKDGGGE